MQENEAQSFLSEAKRQPGEANLVLERVVNLREAFYRMMLADNQGQPVEEADFALFNAELKPMLAQTVIVPHENGFEWGWRGSQDALDGLLWPILLSAVDLITSTEHTRVGVCKGEGCGWLFYDHSRNRSRKWCDMSDCGNRAKARRFYRRQRKGSV